MLGQVVERRRRVLGAGQRQRGGVGERRSGSKGGAGEPAALSGAGRRRRGLAEEQKSVLGAGGVEAVAVRRQLSASSRKKYVHNQFKPDPR